MEKLDLRKQYKHLYLPSAKQVVIVDVPAIKFAMIDGEIEPGASPGMSPSFQQALEALTIEFEAGPNGSYDTDAYKQQLVSNVEAPAKVEFEKGTLDKAFADAAVRFKATYVGSHLSHSPMEPMASLAWVKQDKCEIWASTQDPAGIQQTTQVQWQHQQDERYERYPEPDHSMWVAFRASGRLARS